MNWISETPPHWVWPRDTWERIPDSKKFKADLNKGFWISEDGEIILFPEDCIIDEV